MDKRVQASWEEKAALFGAYLTESGVKSTTLKSYFSAIKSILRKDGYLWDDNKVLLSAIVKGCKIKNDVVTTRLPIQDKLLDMILFEIERYYSRKGAGTNQPFLEAMYKAILVMMYYGMLRIGEVASDSEHTIKAKNIHIGTNKNKILIVLYSSKTHGKESRPQKVKITANNRMRKKYHKFFCPFNILRWYLRLRGPYERDDEPFFVFSDGTGILSRQIRELLRTILKLLNLEASLYNTHSMRGGRAVQLLRYGYSIERIRAAGRWRSSAVYRYLKS